MDKLCKLNNKLLRILLQKNLATPIVDLYAEMKTLPIPILHEMLLWLFVHKYLYHKQLLPEVFQNYFTLNKVIHDHNVRENSGVHIFRVKSSLGQRGTSCRASKYWNNLPEHLRNISSHYIFKKELQLYLVNKYNTLSGLSVYI